MLQKERKELRKYTYTPYIALGEREIAENEKSNLLVFMAQVEGVGTSRRHFEYKR